VKSAYAASGLTLLALTGCGGGSPDERYDGPPASGYEQPAAPGELAGGPAPSSSPASSLAGGPRPAASMQPIPNPEDLPLEERRRIYGPKYDKVVYRPKAGGAPGHHAGPPLRSWRDESGKMVVAMRPVANPEDMSAAERKRVYGNRYAPSAHIGSGGRRRPAPAPTAKPVAAVKPAVPPAVVNSPAPPVAPAPKPVAVTPVPTVAAPKTPATENKLTALSAVVGPEVRSGSRLNIPDTLAKGEEAKVTLSMPANLLDIIQREAAKLGLVKPARKAEVSATLAGEGYTITPNAAQTQPLKAGEAATFNWQVKPGESEKSPLKASADGTLTGQKNKPQTFGLATLEQEVAKVVEPAASAARKLGLPSLDRLAIPGLKPIRVGDTVIPPGAATAGIIAFIIALILIALARGASAGKAREERRRKFRTMTDNSGVEPETTHAPAANPVVNPMLAAAGGFAAGTAAMTFEPRPGVEEVVSPPLVEAAPEAVYVEPVSMTFAPSSDPEPAAQSHSPIPALVLDEVDYNPEVAPPPAPQFVAYPGETHVPPATQSEPLHEPA
jgi:hypothetical protein